MLAFTTEGNDSWKEWDRFLTLDNKKAYHIGNICDTCEFFFERLEGANQSIPIQDKAEFLRDGLNNLDDDAGFMADRAGPRKIF